ncbi:5113_t:CDS:2 [Racocetra fulgida]|uniref:5113_t:CDS:1 n=1 Tax=Racocetra fulgida TaxID=60492 RepID=A0A9N9EYG5_9GLOM|nr:5113_t:CDS:2 [Racocetra fulgida]
MRTHLPSYFIESLAQLIQSQTKLRALSLNRFWNMSSSATIFTAMLKQAESLIYLRFTPKNEYYDLINVLKCCTNLETLELLDLSPTKDSDIDDKSTDTQYVYRESKNINIRKCNTGVNGPHRRVL